VHIRQGVPPGFADNNLIVLLVPLEDGAGPDPEFLTNFGGHGNLALGGKFGMCERHNCYITMVMRQSQRDTRLILRNVDYPENPMAAIVDSSIREYADGFLIH